jgi:hypothetical protein
MPLLEESGELLRFDAAKVVLYSNPIKAASIYMVLIVFMMVVFIVFI